MLVQTLIFSQVVNIVTTVPVGMTLVVRFDADKTEWFFGDHCLEAGVRTDLIEV